MNDLNTDRETRREERRARVMDDVARRAEKNLLDTRLDGVRAPRPRRIVIAAWGTIVVVIVGVTLLDNSLLTVACFVVGGAASWLLRSLVRAVPDMPDEVLDERQISRRDSAYRLAYQALVGLTLAVLISMYMASDAGRLDYEVQPAHINAVFMFVLFTALGLPSAIFGWSEKEL